MMMLHHAMIEVGPQEANLWLMADEATGNGVLVDAGAFDSDTVAWAAANKVTVGWILITHLHWDHVDGLARYLEVWPAARVLTPAPLEAAPGAQIVAGGDQIKAGPFLFEVFKTSGHTPEGVSYHCAELGVCFVGDALFAGSVGGTASDALHHEQLGHLREKILSLPDHTELMPGHGPATTVAIEKTANPFLQQGFGRS